MSFRLQQFIARFQAASEEQEAQDKVETLMYEAMAQPEALSYALADYPKFAKLENLICHRTKTLTSLAGFPRACRRHKMKQSSKDQWGDQWDSIDLDRLNGDPIDALMCLAS